MDFAMLVIAVFDRDSFYAKRIARATERNGVETTLVSWRELDETHLGHFDPNSDVIYFRTGAPAAVRIARAFERAGFKTLNDSRYIQLSGNKYLANVVAASNNIPTPALNVAVDKTNTELLSFYLRQTGAMVAKPIISRDMGRHVELIEDEDSLAVVSSIPGSTILLQSRVKFDRLVRTIVTADGMLTAATTFDVVRSGWKATVCENPLAQAYTDVPDALIRLTNKTVKVFGGDIAFIDFFEQDGRFVFNEINHSCGLMHHERITGYPIAKHLGDYLSKRYAAFVGPAAKHLVDMPD
jgi:glutathione synthase/RimK-type ligase-like ATP-grasp enzyme